MYTYCIGKLLFAAGRAYSAKKASFHAPTRLPASNKHHPTLRTLLLEGKKHRLAFGQSFLTPKSAVRDLEQRFFVCGSISRAGFRPARHHLSRRKKNRRPYLPILPRKYHQKSGYASWTYHHFCGVLQE